MITALVVALILLCVALAGFVGLLLWLILTD